MGCIKDIYLLEEKENQGIEGLKNEVIYALIFSFAQLKFTSPVLRIKA